MSEHRYQKVLDAGTQAQKEKLDENAHKRGLIGYPVDRAFSRAVVEMGELAEAMLEGDPYSIRREAADVANFMHAIVHGMDAKLKNPPCYHCNEGTGEWFEEKGCYHCTSCHREWLPE